MRIFFCLTMLVSCLGRARAQEPASLFRDETPLEIAFKAPLSDIRHEDVDSIYFESVMSFRLPDGSWDSVRIGLRARGNFRRKHCTLPPLRVKINKEDRGKAIFAGVKSLKLVLPCQATRSGDELVLKEYVCYQLYEATTPYVLHTRLVNVKLTETTGKKQQLRLTGFFIEDDDDAAKRFKAKVVGSDKINPFMLQDTCAVRFDIFQFMIGNTDFSTAYFHNTKVMRTRTGALLPVAYDFDMAGFVSAPYATVDASMGIENVKQRKYRGFCRGDAVANCVRNEYLMREPEIYGILDRHQPYFTEKELTGMKRYMKDFFSVMKSDALYKQRVALACRTN